MKISELITLLENDKKRLGDLDIYWIDFNCAPSYEGEDRGENGYVLH